MHFRDTKLRQTSSAFISGNKPRHIGYSWLVGQPEVIQKTGLEEINGDLLEADSWLVGQPEVIQKTGLEEINGDLLEADAL
jgi:hypothetical protein